MAETITKMLLVALTSILPYNFDAVGLATCYAWPHNSVTRSGALYNLNLYGAAVDDSEWGRANYLVIYDIEREQSWILPILDTGYLYDAGLFQFDGRYWQHSKSGVLIVVDVPCGTHHKIFGPGRGDVLVGIHFLSKSTLKGVIE